MIKLITNTNSFYMHDDSMIYDAPQSDALFGDVDSNLLFDSLDSFLATNTVVSVMSEDGYKFYLLDDGRVVDSLDENTRDMSFDTLAQFVEAMQS